MPLELNSALQPFSGGKRNFLAILSMSFEKDTLSDLVDYSRRVLKLQKGDRLCVPFSGGLDSGVVLAVAREVVGANAVRAIRMKHSMTQPHEVEASQQTAERLGVKTHVVDASKVMSACNEAIEPFLEEENSGRCLAVASANRLLYPMVRILASSWGARVPGTLDFTEVVCGYFPKESCTGDFSWIGRIYRTEVRRIAVELGLANLPERLTVVEGCGDIVSYVNHFTGMNYSSEADLDAALMNAIEGKSESSALRSLIAKMSHKAQSVLEGRPVYSKHIDI